MWSPARIEGIDAPVPGSHQTIAISPRGPTVAHPVGLGGAITSWAACPLATPCTAWVTLGDLGSSPAMDETHLYVGTPTGIKRCTLAEISTMGTCTLAAVGPTVAVSPPVYLTATEVWFRSGTTIRRIPK